VAAKSRDRFPGFDSHAAPIDVCLL
jgi:hypothetical protein